MIKLIANGLAIRSSILPHGSKTRAQPRKHGLAALVYLVYTRRSDTTRAVAVLHCALFKRPFPR